MSSLCYNGWFLTSESTEFSFLLRGLKGGTKPIIDATEMFLDMAIAEFIYFGNQTVEELSVVTHDDGCAVESENGFLQYIFRCHVEMVGGFV